MRKITLPHARAIAVGLIASACLAMPPRGAAAQDAGAFIADLGTQAIQVLGPSAPPAQRASRFRQLFQNDFDLANIARFVLGPQGRAKPPPEQQEFLNVFREFLVQSYTARLAEYAGEPFRVTGSRPQDDRTVVTSPGELDRRPAFCASPDPAQWRPPRSPGRGASPADGAAAGAGAGGGLGLLDPADTCARAARTCTVMGHDA